PPPQTPQPPLFPSPPLFRSAGPVQRAAPQPEAGGTDTPPGHLLPRRQRRRREAPLGRYSDRRARARGGVCMVGPGRRGPAQRGGDRKSTRLNSSHVSISYGV